MPIDLAPDTRIGVSDHLQLEAGDGVATGKTLVVAPGTGGWTVTEDAGALALLAHLDANGPASLSDLYALGDPIARVTHDTVRELFDRGLLELDQRVRGTSATRPAPGLELISPKAAHNSYPVLGIFHVHNWCNLACTYCYTIEEGIPREQLSAEVMCKAVDELVEMPTRFTSFEFHGGEPTMAMPAIREVTAHAQRVYARAGKEVRFSIQTNAYNLSPQVCRFLADNDFSVRVSLDGTPGTHDEFRVDHAGKGSYRGVVRGIRRLQELGIAVHAVCVVHAGTADRIVEMYDSMAALDVASVRFLPVFTTGKAGLEQWLTGDRYLAAYLGVVRHVARLGRSGAPSVPLANLTAGELGSLRSFKREYMCMRNPCGAGVNMITVDTNGDLYPCEEMVGKPEFVIGNLRSETIRDVLDTSPVVRQLRERHVEEIDECAKCTWKQMCHGGCVHKSYTHFKRLDRESEHCSYYKGVYRELIWLDVKEPGSWEALSPSGARR
ncbi:radical SAM protein [Streptomyces sp. So13.3]|uniref:radical SAM/SPASM domain-containing protein n=1 Tax=Streptomyces sp. So13.3 TaxID=2136173 RepID=UPI0011070474|nr:radical SAM protein [Streptomyces sp. So13.3]QNA76772.1 radical SAM protein [Streptomyces sp. So13.3]